MAAAAAPLLPDPEYIVLEGYGDWGMWNANSYLTKTNQNGSLRHPQTEEEAIRWAIQEIQGNPEDICPIRIICFIVDRRNGRLVALKNEMRSTCAKYSNSCIVVGLGLDPRIRPLSSTFRIWREVSDLNLNPEDIPNKEHFVHKSVLFSFPDLQVRILKEKIVDPLRRQVEELQQQVTQLQAGAPLVQQVNHEEDPGAPQGGRRMTRSKKKLIRKTRSRN